MNDKEKIEMITIVDELLIHFANSTMTIGNYAKIERLKEILES